MIETAKVKNGKVVHKAFDMGGFLYIACHADPTTLKTEKVQGEITCKKCLALKRMVTPNYQFAEGIHALKHPFCRTEGDRDGFGAGWHDGKYNLKKYLPNGLSDDFIKGYNEGYYEGQHNYAYHQQNSNSNPSSSTKPANAKNSGCLIFLFVLGGLGGIMNFVGHFF